MKAGIDKILSELRDDDETIRLKVQPQEGDWITISFHINYNQRVGLIDCIENEATIPYQFLYALAESIRKKELNRDSWKAEEAEYYQRMADLMLKYDKNL